MQSRWIPDRTLAVVSDTITQEQVEPFIIGAFNTLFDLVGANPRLRVLGTTKDEPTYAMFHGDPGEGPVLVEAAIVVSAHAALEIDLAGSPITLRVEPGHEEAYVPILKRDLPVPAILKAYDAVFAWVEQHGEQVAGLPAREVYITDVMPAPEDEHVADVALPYAPR